ncbi:MAG: phosphatidylserine decarboxylase, partial [Lysobacter sp.]|nr:phosphatidylserine decarboxylase [Lysobacter sp.]
MQLVTALTYVLPHRFLSSLARRLAYSADPRVKQWLIDTVVDKFDVDMSEAAEPDTTRYPTFNA